MNKDTICREDAIDEMERIMADHPLQGYEDELLLINAIKSLPSADRPKGEWRDLNDNFAPLDKDGCTTASAWCSNCGEWLTGSDEYGTKGRFCPNCGARMKGADDESK